MSETLVFLVFEPIRARNSIYLYYFSIFKQNTMVDNKYSEYKVVRVSESGCSAILFGSAALPMKKINAVLNENAKEGWQVVFEIVETKRLWLFWARESLLVTLGR